MPKVRQTYFQLDWLTKSEFKDFTEEKVNTHAFCQLCKKSVFLSNMGQGALESHMKGATHRKKAAAVSTSADIRMFGTGSRTRPEPNVAVNDGANPDDPLPLDALANAAAASAPSTTVDAAATTSTPAAGPDVLSRIDRFLKKDDVTTAEILWCLQSVENHTSLSATGKQSVLFPRMFPDSRIATSMNLGRTKTGYGIVHGLAPYFHNRLLGFVKESGAFVVAFDESLNKMSQKQQMDIAVRFWDPSGAEVKTHYFSSAFLGRGRAVDLLGAFNAELHDLNYDNLVQISMDGPNVNWAFLKDFEADRRSLSGDSAPMFINTGSCGLHNVNNSFKAGAKATNWNVVEFLRSIYWVFKDSPTRRSNYLRFNAPNKPLLPKKFCSVRWLENEDVADRALSIIKPLINYVNGNKEEKNTISSKTYKSMTEALNDKMLPAKIAFFSFVSSQVTPFLREYQCDKPMTPFLYTDLTATVRDIMALFVKSAVLDKSNSICNIELKGDNLLSSSKIDVGHAVRAELKKHSFSKEAISNFRDECQKFLIALCNSLLKKSPLKYSICKSLTFCDPVLISSHLSVCKSRLSSALDTFSSRNRISSKQCDKVSKEFRTLTSKAEVISLCKEYDRKSQRVDHFWRDLLSANSDYDALFEFIKQVLIMSHGQAFVERGFSINSEIIVENQLSESLVAQRQVYDGLMSEGGVAKIEVTKQMILSFRNARDRYGEALEKRRADAEGELATAQLKRSMAQKVAELKSKKAKLMSQNASELAALDDEINSLKYKM